MYPSDSQFLRWLQHPLVDVEEINLRQSMIETLCSEKALIDTLQKGSGMLRGLPGEPETTCYSVVNYHLIQQQGCRLLLRRKKKACHGPWLNLSAHQQRSWCYTQWSLLFLCILLRASLLRTVSSYISCCPFSHFSRPGQNYAKVLACTDKGNVSDFARSLSCGDAAVVDCRCPG